MRLTASTQDVAATALAQQPDVDSDFGLSAIQFTDTPGDYTAGALLGSVPLTAPAFGTVLGGFVFLNLPLSWTWGRGGAPAEFRFLDGGGVESWRGDASPGGELAGPATVFAGETGEVGEYCIFYPSSDAKFPLPVTATGAVASPTIARGLVPSTVIAAGAVPDPTLILIPVGTDTTVTPIPVTAQGVVRLPNVSVEGDPPPTDDSGFTVFTPSVDTRTIYVSNTGSDAADGLTPATAKATTAAGALLMRNGFPDWMLLERGGVWNSTLAAQGSGWNYSGRSPSEKMLFGAYGSTALPRPHLTGTADPKFNFNIIDTYVSNIAFVDLHFSGAERAIDMRTVRDVIIENCDCDGSGLFLASANSDPLAPITRVTVRRCLVYNTISQGIFCSAVHDVVVEENFVHNNGSTSQVRSHNIYMSGESPNAICGTTNFPVGNSGNTIRNNLLSRSGGNYQIKFRVHDDGLIERNVFSQGRNGVEWHTKWGDEYANRNIFRENVNINHGNPDQVINGGGGGIRISGQDSGIVADNIWSNSHPSNGLRPNFTISFEPPERDFMPESATPNCNSPDGIDTVPIGTDFPAPTDILFKNNIMYGWKSTGYIFSNASSNRPPPGIMPYSGLRLFNNACILTNGTGSRPMVMTEAIRIGGVADAFVGSSLDGAWSLLNSGLMTTSVSAGEFHIQPTGTSLWFQDDEGPLVYQTITGDFVATATVRADSLAVPGDPVPIGPGVRPRLGGLLARDPASIPGDRNSVHVVVGSGGAADPVVVEDKSTDGSVSDFAFVAIAESAGEVRLTRVGSVFTMLYRAPRTALWITLRSHTRADLPATLQVGMMTYSNASTPDVAIHFDDVSLESGDGVVFAGNQYHITDNNPTTWWDAGPGNGWQNQAGWEAVSGEVGVSVAAPTYSDPSRNTESYIQSLGIGTTYTDWIALMLARDKGNWNPDLDALPTINYIRAGFDLPALI